MCVSSATCFDLQVGYRLAHKIKKPIKEERIKYKNKYSNINIYACILRSLP
jgi:hypothetical protein